MSFIDPIEPNFGEIIPSDDDFDFDDDFDDDDFDLDEDYDDD
jgi:hypothetical protein